MVPQPQRRGSRRLASLSAVLTALASLSLASACDKVPLLAPSGSVITLFPAAPSVPVNGSIEIVATVIENGVTATPPTGGTPGGTPGGAPGGTPGGTTSTSQPGAGTPVQNGTLVSFTTTLGRIEPSEARTENGQVRVKFIASGQSGMATITAFSGGASGRIENLAIGSAAAERVTLTASPQILGPAGGATQIAARVEDTSGTGVVGVPVSFSSNAGQLSSSTAVTDETGTARVTLTTTRESIVRVSVAGKTAELTVGLNPRTGITITAPASTISAGLPATFQVGVGSTANVRDVVVDFGDGSRQSLGAISGTTTVQHTYTTPNTYTVTARATEASGFTEDVSTSITILPGQPPSVIITASNNNPGVNETVIFTATVSGATSTILSYEWNFGSGAQPPTAITTGNRASASYASPGSKVITVRVIQAAGPNGDGTGSIVVRQ